MRIGGSGIWAGIMAGTAATLIGLSGCGKSESASSDASSKVKIGYVVKQPDEPWFQTEMAFARKAGEENGFDVVTLAAQDGEKALACIDNLAAQGAKGLVICTPDVRLGPALVAKADGYGMKLMSVDDQFVGADGKIMSEVPHIGVAAREVGHVAGQSLFDQIKARGWDPKEVGACIVTFDELDTARERTEGLMEKLVENGFPKDHIYTTPEKTTDIPGSFDASTALLAQHGDVKHWIAGGMNDSAALGAVRALEGRGFNADTAIAVGINGTDCIDELKKPQPTAFYGSVLMEANVHGHDSTLECYKWATGGPKPQTHFTGGKLITRANFESELKAHGMWPKE
ncbi:MAG: substrate-binding domain-containing protein [Tepidisphaeraceae bacterium]